MVAIEQRRQILRLRARPAERPQARLDPEPLCRPLRPERVAVGPAAPAALAQPLDLGLGLRRVSVRQPVARQGHRGRHRAAGRAEEARSAYKRVLAVNSADVRARYNLACVHTRLKDYLAALGRIAEAFALDRTGEYRERLLQKQQEVLVLLARRHQQEYLLLINLVSKYAK